MKKFIILPFLATLLNANSPYDAYIKLLESLKPNEITALVEILAASELPAKIDENLNLISIKAKNESLIGQFEVKSPTKNLKQNLIKDGKQDLCKEKVFTEILKRNIELIGYFKHEQKDLFKIHVDKKFCD